MNIKAKQMDFRKFSDLLTRIPGCAGLSQIVFQCRCSQNEKRKKMTLLADGKPGQIKDKGNTEINFIYKGQQVAFPLLDTWIMY
jgi:hypothetical protein